MIRQEPSADKSAQETKVKTAQLEGQPFPIWRAGLAGLIVLLVICFSLAMNLDRAIYAAPGDRQATPALPAPANNATSDSPGTPQAVTVMTPTLSHAPAVTPTIPITPAAAPILTATLTLPPTDAPTALSSATAVPTASQTPAVTTTSPAMPTTPTTSTPTATSTTLPSATDPPPAGSAPANTATPTPTPSIMSTDAPTPTSTPTHPPTDIAPPPVGLSPANTATALSSATAKPPASPTPTPTPTAPPPVPMDRALEAEPLPTATAPPAAPTSVPGPDDPHVAYDALTDTCAACHRSHTASGIALRQTWPEESLCFGCHASAGPGTDIQASFASYTNTLTSYFKHDIAANNGVHRAGQTDGADFGGANRHVECEDCHEPHEATRGAASAPMLQREMNEVSGVDPAWTAEGAPDSFAWLPQAEREYQVCFKCHSSFTTLPTYIPDGWNGSDYVSDGLLKLTSNNSLQVKDSRDMAREFNPYNTSFHPVVTQGRNQSMPAAGFVAGWDQTSLIYCSDCHGNADAATQGDGPHGSPLLHLLVGALQNGGQANYTSSGAGTAGSTSNQQICFKCHEVAVYTVRNNFDTNFSKGQRNLHAVHMLWGTTCYNCHDTHGSEQEHLINFELSTDLQPYPGLNSQTAWHPAPMDRMGCSLICHGVNHNGMTGMYWYP